MQQADILEDQDMVNVQFTSLPNSLIAYKVAEDVLRQGQLRVSIVYLTGFYCTV